MFVLIYSIFVGLYGLMIVAYNLRRPRHMIAIVALLLLLAIGVSNSGSIGLLTCVKIVLAYGCVVAASGNPKRILFATGAILCFSAFVEISVFGLSKVYAFPSIGLFLLACAAYMHHRMLARALILLGVISAFLNFTFLIYRTEAILVASIAFCFLVFSRKWHRLGSAILFLPIASSTILFFIGSQFAISLDTATIYTLSIESTASNFERSFFSFAILSSMVEYPLGQSLSEATYGLREAANTIGRVFYESSTLDPHNFFLFFSMCFGFVGSFVFLLFVWRTFITCALRSTNGNVAITAILLSIAAVTMSFFPFSTEPRTIAAICIGAALRMSHSISGQSYRNQSASRHSNLNSSVLKIHDRANGLQPN